MTLSRLEKFGTPFDSWANSNKRDARSSWKILQAIMQLYGIKSKYSIAEDFFLDIANNIKPFHGLNYEIIGDQGTVLNLNVPELAVKV
jgi:predicted molibdopterin-dependent oxidoreductase YjgC